MPVSYSLSEVTQMLGISRPTVEVRVRQGRLREIPGSSPAQIDEASLRKELDRLIEDTSERLQQLEQARHQMPEDDAEPTTTRESHPASGIASLAAALASERAGRALAEARIDDLKADLQRANRAIRALQVDPDAGFT